MSSFSFIKRYRFPIFLLCGWLVLTSTLIVTTCLLHGRPVSFEDILGSWDGTWYRSIIETGYYAGRPTAQVNTAFFPLYPIIVFALSHALSLPIVWTGIAVSVCAFAAALMMLYRFVTTWHGEKTARWAVTLLALNPFSLYFGMMYTESLFLLLAVTTFWFVRRRQWWPAALSAGLASGTRSVGIALSCVVLVAYLWDTRKNWHLPKLIGLGLLASAGAVLFTLYLYVHTGSILTFFQSQAFWPGRSGIGGLVTEVRHIAGHIRHLPLHADELVLDMWFSVTVLGFVGLGLLIRWREYLYAVYVALGLLLPLLPGTMAAMNRYVIVLFPLFIAAARLVQKQKTPIKIGVISLWILGASVAMYALTDPRHPFIG